MIRILVFLLLCGLAAAGAAWLADHPGTVVIDWQGWRLQTSLGVLLAAVAAVAILAILLLALLRLAIQGPEALSMALRGRRRQRGERAVARGLVAVGIGDGSAARRAADEAEKLLGTVPLSLFLRAQAAQLTDHGAEADSAFRRMIDLPETRALGLRGLFVERRRRGDLVAARAIAEEAVRSTPDAPWATEALIDFQCAERDWAGARATVELARHHGLIDRKALRRRRAVLLTAEALDKAENAPEEAKALALEATKLAPDLIPAAALAGRLFAEAGDPRKASKLVEAAWASEPHPDLAEVYLRARAADGAQDRLKRARHLFDLAPQDPESALTVARAAIDARAFDDARLILKPLVDARPSQRTCLMMAEIAEREHGDRGAARAWLARALKAPRDKAWIADGIAADQWAPLSPVTGQLDAYRWTTPAEGLQVPHDPLLDAALAGAVTAEPQPRPAPPLAPAPEPAAPAGEAASPAVEEIEDLETLPAAPPAVPVPPAAPAAPAAAAAAATTATATAAAANGARRPQPVMPVMHAPDDPGPDGTLEPEPAHRPIEPRYGP